MYQDFNILDETPTRQRVALLKNHINIIILRMCRSAILQIKISWLQCTLKCTSNTIWQNLQESTNIIHNSDNEPEQVPLSVSKIRGGLLHQKIVQELAFQAQRNWRN